MLSKVFPSNICTEGQSGATECIAIAHAYFN